LSSGGAVATHTGELFSNRRPSEKLIEIIEKIIKKLVKNA
jgi:hypothetical protein